MSRVIIELSGSRRVFGRAEWRWKNSAQVHAGKLSAAVTCAVVSHNLCINHTQGGTQTQVRGLILCIYKCLCDFDKSYFRFFFLSHDPINQLCDSLRKTTFDVSYRLSFLSCCSIHGRCHLHFYTGAVGKILICGTLENINQDENRSCRCSKQT